MSRKDDFTAEEWQLLLDVPPLAGTTVMLSSNSGLGTMKEAFAIASGVLGARDTFEGDPLIAALIEGRISGEDRSEIEKLQNKYRGMSFDELRAATLDKCQEAARLLDEKATAQEARHFKEWVMSVGKKVSEAAKEGGFLGLGGERVSEAETEALAQIEQALQLSRPS